MRCKILLSIMSLGLCVSLNAFADKEGDLLAQSLYNSNKSLFQEVGLNVNSISSFTGSTIIRNCLLGKKPEAALGTQVTRNTGDALADYEPSFPHATQPKISCVEKNILAAYLDNSKNLAIVKFLALYHLSNANFGGSISNASEIKEVLYAEYFLNRIQDLGANEKWVERSLKLLDAKLNKVNAKSSGVDLDETHPAQVYYYETFNHYEYNRYIAIDRLLEDYIKHPNSMLTTFLTMAGNNWLAGEANYDDPTILYNFIVSGYFAFRAMDLAQQAEKAWELDPVNHQRFRLASIIGGFSAMQRRSLAEIHHDPAAIKRIDNEHREWRLINPAFHAFSVGLTFFGEEENFLEGLFAYEDAFTNGDARPFLPTVQDRPRFSFNIEGIWLGRVDYAMKAGDVGAANFYLMITQLYLPATQFWDYGRAAIEHRVTNFDSIVARYSNDNPADDPLPLMVKRHKWGGPDSVCQICHQQQSHYWSDAEKANIILPPDDILTIGTFPAKTTTWYGAIKNL